MPCFHPLHAKKIQIVNAHGELKNRLVFPADWRGAFRPSLEVMQSYHNYCSVACGQCIGCRIARSRDWAHRCMHELQSHAQACFVTLTYDDDYLPRDASLHYEHFQKFIKRLRYYLKGKKIKYYMCGEYGDTTGRPHYHFILFGHDFSDDRFFYKMHKGNALFNSSLLSSAWPQGHAVIGNVTFESCAYVARYILKKVNGKKAVEAYARVDAYGNRYSIAPEMTRMSQGIGKSWAQKYIDDCLPSGYIVSNGRKARVPKFYMRVFEAMAPARVATFRAEQVERMRLLTSTGAYRANHELLRLQAREAHFAYKIKKLLRPLL